MLKCSTSLWSADLANLASEIRRVEPHSERFHLDVADGHYVPALLFFPDLVAAIRQHTAVPFEVHLMTTDPLAWVGPFSDAGADGFIVCLDTADAPSEVIRAVKRRGKFVGVSLRIEEGLERIEPYWQDLDQVTIFGTAVGIKGAAMDAGTPDKVRQARGIIDRQGLPAEVEVDGGIRRESVPLLRAAGADWIVPGSLMFGEDPAEMRRWLASL
jgi:ribulose-phosphate 3-epimerase